jgi:hypothetical protein
VSDKQPEDHLTEPEIAERLNRGLQRAFTMKPKLHDKGKKRGADPENETKG